MQKVATISLALFLAGCNAGSSTSSSPVAASGRSCQTQYTTRVWYDNQHDTVLDGAIRTIVWAAKDERFVTLRCIQNSAATGASKRYDLRYLIDVPLLKKLARRLNKVGHLSLIVAIDGKAIGSFKARAGTSGDDLWFLSRIDAAVLRKLAMARRSIVVMPRKHREKLDKIIRFGVGGLKRQAAELLKACGNGWPAPAASSRIMTAKRA